MRCFSIFLWFFSVPLFFLHAQTPATISGTIHGVEGKEIHLMLSTDYLMEEGRSVQKKIISEDGTFSFEISIPDITPVALSVNFYTFDFFIAPGKKYELNGENVVLNNSINPFIIKPRLPLTFADIDPLNRFIGQFYEKKYQLESTKYREIFDSQDFSDFDYLMMPVEQLPEQYRTFCNDYQFFSIGALKAVYAKKRSAKLAATYLNAKAPNIEDYCYMLFFNAFFDSYIPDHSTGISFPELQNAVNKAQNVADVFNVLKKDPVFSNEEIRALFLVKLLTTYPFRQAAIDKLLGDLASSNYSAQVKKAAGDALQQISGGLLPNNKAPNFSLPTASGSIIKTDDFKGKFLYINFFKSNCYDCLSEMEYMRELYERNNRFFEFISICIDNEEEGFQTLMKTYNYPWKVVYGGYNQDFILQWNAKSIPYYILIDNQYKIMECPALSPETGINHIMEKISWEEQRKQRK